MATLTKWQEAIFQERLNSKKEWTQSSKTVRKRLRLLLMYHPQIFIHLFTIYFFIFIKKKYFKTHKKARLLTFIPLLISCGLSFPLSASISGESSHLVTSEKLEKVSLIYYQYFPCHRLNCYRHVKGCRVVYRASVSDPVSRRFFQCTATMQFLRPAKTVKKWQMPDDNGEHLSIKVKKPGTCNVHDHMTSIRETAANRVTGKFKRYVLDVRQYTFKTIKTGMISTVNATPGHLFYVTGRHRFMPVTSISSQDRLITASGEKVQLLCHSGQKKHCGVSLNRGLPVPVFNFEVGQRHIYFIGDTAVMVHNMCGEDKKKRMQKQEITSGDIEAEELFGRKNTLDTSHSGRLRARLIERIYSREVPYERALRLVIADNRETPIMESHGAVYSLSSLQQLHAQNMLDKLPSVRGKLIGIRDSNGNFFDLDNLPNMVFYQNGYRLSNNTKQASSELKREAGMYGGMLTCMVGLTCIVLGLYGATLFY